MFAFATLVCGIGSWVPLIVVLTAPLTLAFFVLAQLTAAHHGVRGTTGSRGRANVAWTGLVLGLGGVGLQAAVAGAAMLPGWLVSLFGS
ncbi:MAG: hypothetical protein H6698_02025 [Myxococcales bacterium]|nr:hypothetical protein [Myxococcales bacterium]